MALRGLLPVPTRVLTMLVIALAAIWLANNVSFINRLTRARSA